jgi:hypothetical protein
MINIKKESVEKIEKHIMQNLTSGTRCPCCNRYCKIYKRSITNRMAQWLIWLVKVSKNNEWTNWRDAPKKVVHGGDYGKMFHWGLIEHAPNANPKKKSSGVWRPTDKGIRFVYRQVTVPKKISLLFNEVIGLSEEKIDIVDALGNEFDYNQLMND